MSRLRVKICGVTRPEDAELAVGLGAELVGLNFYPPSPRFLSLARAGEIAAAVAGRAKVVAVVVDPGPEELAAIEAAVAPDLLQFHGDEGPEALEPFGRRALKAFRLGPDFDPAEVSRYADAWGYLFERRHPSLYGGTGKTWSYETMAGLAGGRPALVAGGITPENAAKAARLSRAWGIDVCSGVESAPGIKSPERMRKLFAALDAVD